jgi:RND family efflux transporter MFP subunit
MVQQGELGGGLQGNFQYWVDLEIHAEEELEDAEEELEELLDELSMRVSNDVALDVAEKQLLVKQKQLALEDAQLDVEDAKKAVADAEYALDEARLDVEEARHDVEEAKLDVTDAEKELLNTQEKLEEANDKSPIIEAPFDGFITKVNVEGGDEVLTGTVAVQLADPNRFEADIMVSEMDIFQVKLGGEAWVQVDAMSGLTLPAEVIHISPTSTIQSGVVNYEVKVELQSLESATQKRQAAISEDFQLREGLTVTVTIMVAEQTDILLVPNNAITLRGTEAYVQVVKDDATEERAIETGISDWQYTEVISGLSEGEQVIVPKGSAITSTTQQAGSRGGTMMFGPPPR